MLEKGWGHSELGIYDTTIQISPSPTALGPFQFFVWALASVHPSSCVLDPKRWSPIPSLMAQIIFLL